MIVPMKKVTLLAMESEAQSSLNALRDLGVMQIESHDGAPSVNTAGLAENIVSGKRLLSALEKYFSDHKGRSGSAKNGREALAELEEILEKRSAVLNELDTVNGRLNALAVWGDFDRKQIDELREKGIYLTLCSSSPQKLAELQERGDLQISVMDDEVLRVSSLRT